MTATRTIVFGSAAGALVLAAALAWLRAPAAVRPDAPAAAAAPAQGGARWLDPAMLPAVAPAPARADFVTADAMPIYGRNGRPVDFGGKDAARYIDERAAAARTGDMRAAYQLYQAASACAAAAEPLPEFADPAQGETFRRERARVAALCAKVSPVQLQERMRFLARAADAGNRDAQIDFFMEGPGGKPADPTASADDPQVQQWKQQALTYLQQAGNQCDHFALGLLSNAYDAGQVVARDPARSMAYAIAAADARHRPLTEQQLRERFGDEVAPADFAAGVQAGAALAHQACPAG
ncbi:hypothetical protein HH212_14425 [Massilia forsythiae]|uniref:Sel1 repeat family protein n=1 Tax=Massilia forsythiae TaxID=2728020 RepID=A0A7Z2VXS3_9BURK|nr:hypothetical protein [Massilia forsythiae]QJE01079.1 hypothetical protein HH212_14425 [Massilia forsythiae]